MGRGQLTIGDLRDLADRDTSGRSLDLGLAVGQDRNDRGGDNLGTHNLARARVGGAPTRHQDDLDGVTLGGPVTVVQVVEVSGGALVPNSAATKGQRAIAAGGESGSVDGACLGRRVVLELEVASDVTSATLGVGEDAILQGVNEDALAGALGALLSRGCTG